MDPPTGGGMRNLKRAIHQFAYNQVCTIHLLPMMFSYYHRNIGSIFTQRIAYKADAYIN